MDLCWGCVSPQPARGTTHFGELTSRWAQEHHPSIETNSLDGVHDILNRQMVDALTEGGEVKEAEETEEFCASHERIELYCTINEENREDT